VTVADPVVGTARGRDFRKKVCCDNETHFGDGGDADFGVGAHTAQRLTRARGSAPPGPRLTWADRQYVMAPPSPNPPGPASGFPGRATPPRRRPAGPPGESGLRGGFPGTASGMDIPRLPRETTARRRCGRDGRVRR